MYQPRSSWARAVFKLIVRMKHIAHMMKVKTTVGFILPTCSYDFVAPIYEESAKISQFERQYVRLAPTHDSFSTEKQ